MTVRKVAEGAFFVPPYYRTNINSHVPGLVDHGITVDEPEFEEETASELTREVFENVLKQIARPVVIQRASKKKRS